MRSYSRFQITTKQAVDELEEDILALGGRSIILTSNKRDLLNDEADEPEDAGVAMHFLLGGKQQVFACDRYNCIRCNVRALGLTVRNFRAIKRYGASDMLDLALEALAALPPPVSPWQVLEIDPGSSFEQIEAAFRRLAMKHHPDRGGSTAAMAELIRARDEALRA
jgi:hypothetical protein